MAHLERSFSGRSNIQDDNVSSSNALKGRNEAIAQGQRVLLGSAPKASSSTTPLAVSESKPLGFTLVVCGATNHLQDGSIFGDFLAFCKVFGEKGITGDFISCFPTEQHMVYLKNEHGIDDLKWGKVGPRPDQGPIFTFTREQLVMHQNPWKQVGAEVLKAMVTTWVDEKARIAKAGDVIKIVIEAHGGSKKGIQLGNHFWTTWEFSEALGRFADGVQVNAISSACHSGIFIDAIKATNQSPRYIAAACGSTELAFGATRSASNRTRGSKYEQAWVMSLARLGLFNAPVLEEAVAIEEHEKSIRLCMERAFTPSRLSQRSQFHISEPLNLASAVEDLIFKDKIDIEYDPRITSRRRRIEWPSLDPAFLNLLSQVGSRVTQSADVRESTKRIIDSEIGKCGRNDPCPYDIGIWDGYLYGISEKVKANGIIETLKALYYRGRIQSTVWDVFVMLEMRGFVNINSLREPISLLRGSPAVDAVSWLLSTFEAVAREESPNMIGNKPYALWDTQFLYEAIQWLATMIVRDCADINGLFEAIEASDFLGGVNREAFEEYAQHCDQKEITCNAKERSANAQLVDIYGFWLPHGLGNVEFHALIDGIRSQINRFNAIEWAFKHFFSLGDEHLLTEESQVEYYSRNPEKVPGGIVERRQYSDFTR